LDERAASGCDYLDLAETNTGLLDVVANGSFASQAGILSRQPSDTD
jgi:hypothetical protein